MAQTKRVCQAPDRLSLQLRFQCLMEPEVNAYIASVKKKFQKYAMPIEEARKIIDRAMGEKTLGDLLHDTRRSAV